MWELGVRGEIPRLLPSQSPGPALGRIGRRGDRVDAEDAGVRGKKGSPQWLKTKN